MRNYAKAFCLALCLLLLCACAEVKSSSPASATSSFSQDVAPVVSHEASLDEHAALLADVASLRPLTREFLLWGCENVGDAFAEELAASVANGTYHDDMFYSLYGQTLLVLYDRFTGETEANEYIHVVSYEGTSGVLAFTGDINLADTWENMQVYHTTGMLEDCVTPPVLARMRAADVLLVNNEFTFTDGGTPLAGKQYTFRAATQNVALLYEMGVDIVSLANNHVYDFGPGAFDDTLETLSGAGIPYVGAGYTLEEAMQPQYFIVNGIKVAYVAASRAEKYIMTPLATETEGGILRCYEDEEHLLFAAVEMARQNADIVIVYPHWGTENTYVLEDVQVRLAHELIDAGADIIVGAHPHQLQGIEYYNDKPIVYSLGNYWFNTDTVDTALLEIALYSPSEWDMVIQPCLQTGGRLYLLEERADRRRIFDKLESYSQGIIIADDGHVTPLE